MSNEKKMNTLFLFSDEHSKRMLGCYGNSIIKTPNMDRLANEGARFDSAYCNNPICMPSRASMAIGDYGSKHSYWDNVSPYEGKVKSWGHRLVDEGYNVVTTGKLHFKDDSSASGFPDQRNPMHAKDNIGDIFGLVRGFEYDQYRDTFGQYIKDARWGDAPNLQFDRDTTEETVNFLLNEAGKKPDKPWVLKVGLLAPHFPLVAPEEYKNLYPLDKIPFPKQYKLEERPNHPVLEEIRKYMGIDAELTEEEVKNAIAVYYGMCTFLDDQIGIILDALKKSGQAENTRIVYTSDHGDMMGEHGLWFKEIYYEEAAGVPLIINGPDIKPTVIKENVSLIDIYPTMLDMSGVSFKAEDEEKPGTSLLPVAKEEEKLDKDRVVISEYYADSIVTALYMVKNGRYKYVYHVDRTKQLFDLQEDPHELVDLGQTKGYEGIMDKLETELRKVLDPEMLHCRYKAESYEKMKKYGGHAHILRQGPGFSFTPIPEKKKKN